MLIAGMKQALGQGAAKDERCPFQTSVADMIGEVLAQAVKIWEDKLSEALANVESATTVKTEKEAAVTSAEATLASKSEDTKTKQEALVAADEAITVATSELSEAQQAVDSCGAEKNAKEEELAE